MVRTLIPIFFLIAGCKYDPAGNNPGGDAGDDNPDGTPDAQVCFGSAGWTVCLMPLPTDPVVLTGTIDTNPGAPLCANPTPAMWMAGGQRDACFIIGTTITLASAETVDVEGDRPLVLLATESISIDGTLDVASHLADGKRGPGASFDTGCNSSNGQSNSSRGGGGGGGSFGTLGADGGAGDSGNAQKGLPGPVASPPHDLLRAGCRGGGGSQGADDGRSGAHAGGAVYLVASTITIAGVINASGAGGEGGDASRGGAAGGGAGGMIALDASLLTVTGTLIANGGGGGGGADNGNDGGNGGEANPTTPLVAATLGTKGGPAGGDGGAGATRDTIASPGAQAGDGGGGGGGGLGVIRVLAGALPTGDLISPAATN